MVVGMIVAVMVRVVVVMLVMMMIVMRVPVRARSTPGKCANCARERCRHLPRPSVQRHNRPTILAAAQAAP